MESGKCIMVARGDQGTNSHPKGVPGAEVEHVGALQGSLIVRLGSSLGSSMLPRRSETCAQAKGEDARRSCSSCNVTIQQLGVFKEGSIVGEEISVICTLTDAMMSEKAMKYLLTRPGVCAPLDPDFCPFILAKQKNMKHIADATQFGMVADATRISRRLR